MNNQTAPVRVAILTCEYPPFPGGIATYIAQVTRVLRGQGVRTLVMAPAYEGAAAEPDVERWFGHHKISPGAALKVLRRVSALPRDAILLASDIRTVLLAWVLRLATGRPYRVVIHGSEVSKFAGASPIKPLVRAAYRAATLISANSGATRDAFIASFGDHPGLVVNYLGVDEACFAPVDGAFESPELAAIAPDRPIAMTVGRIEDRKGQVEAVEVTAAARAISGADIVYVAAGTVVEPEYRTRIQAAAARTGAPVILAGRISDADVARLYQRAVCQLLCAQPSDGKIEGFGLVLVEAAARGCVSVTTRVGGIPEVMAQLGGEVSAPDDIDAMAAALVTALGTADAGARAVLTARARLFTWETCVSGIFPELSPGSVSRARPTAA